MVIGKGKDKLDSLPLIFKKIYESTFQEEILKRILQIVNGSGKNDG